MNRSVTMPRSVDDTVAALAETLDAVLLAGGTDLMPAINAGRLRPRRVIGAGRVDELRGWRRTDDRLVFGAGLTYADLDRPSLAELAPALAQAARTVGSPQVRSAGTIGGSLGS